MSVVRPLLGWRRDDLRAIVMVTGTPFVDDPSNSDEAYERVRVRGLIAQNPWLDVQGLSQAAASAAEADRALTELREWLWTSRSARPSIDSAYDEVWLRLADLPREMQRRLAREAIIACRAMSGLVQPAFDKGSNIEALLDALNAGRGATKAGIQVSVDDGVWHFREAPPRRTT